MIHNFNECLKRSHEAEDLPVWEQVYRKAFPGFVGMHSHKQDGWHQRAGIDRSIILDNTKQIFIDEKIRGVDYGDILLEWLSNDKTGALGWVCKPLAADYIAYLIAPSGTCHMLPVIQLQRAWAKNKNEWKCKYKTKSAHNGSYRTWFTCVPIKVLYPAIGAQFRVSFEPFQWDEKEKKVLAGVF